MVNSINNNMANLWTPIFLPFGSLANWYDSTDTTTLTLSTGNKVADWRDKSYNNNNLSETNGNQLPLYGGTNINGLSTLDFSIGESPTINLDTTASLNGNYYIMYVGHNEDYTSTSTMFHFTSGAGGAGNGLEGLLLRSTSDTSSSILFRSTGNPNKNYNMTHEPLSSFGGNVVFTLNVLTDGDVGFRLNFNNALSGGSLVATITDFPIVNNLTLGTQDPNELGGLNGQTGEFIIMQQDLIADDDKEKLEGYAAWKWGMQDLLLVDHPYKLAAPTVTDVEFRNKLYETSTEEGSSRFRRLFELGFVG